MLVYSFTDKKYPRPPEFVSGPDWPLQFSEAYSQFYKKYYRQKILLLQDKSSKAWIPLSTHTSKFIKFGQILHAPVHSAIELKWSAQQTFFERMTWFLRENKIIHRLLQPHPSGLSLAVPEHSKYTRFGTFVTDLQSYPTDQDLLNSFDPKYKKAIQHSIKHQARVVLGAGCHDDFFTIYQKTCQRNHLHSDPEKYFIEQRDTLGSNHTETGVVYDNDQPVGCIFIVYSKHSALCTHAGSGGSTPLYGAMKYLHFEMMKHLKAKGVQYYDLVGVRIGSNDPALEGIFRFKKGFGGTLKEGYLWKMDLYPHPLKVYDWLQKIRNINLRGDIIDQESAYPAP